ncbi:hypothetical protein HDA40_006231 [Hamadaea flava]|uniref:Uncharacterized protein n=1 Tax=Hamadaea flava TaxID=1742688 RepID=A0ABV8LTR1_9ACTN|nr:hypothetical protein [Hamadaea flava]MCP2327724.1 hypothetical protein [Hamadaea flava]
MRRLLAVAASTLATGLLIGTPAFADATVTASPETVRPGGTTTVTAGSRDGEYQDNVVVFAVLTGVR